MEEHGLNCRCTHALQVSYGAVIFVPQINNAGATWGAPFDEYPDKAWDRCMDLNVRAVFNLTQKMAPYLEAAGTAADPARVS